MQCDVQTVENRVEDIAEAKSMNRFDRRLMRRLRGQGQILESNLARVVVVVTILAVIGGFTALLLTSKSQNEQAQINTIVASIANQFGSAADYTGISEKIVANGGHLQPSWVTGTVPNATGINSLFKSPITVGIGATASTYTISITNVPQANCVDLATMGMGPNLVSITAGATTVTTGLPMGAVAAAGACAAGATNTVAWTMQ